MNSRGSVSVVIPVYNSEKFLQSTLDRLVLELERDDEVICIDDGSSDNSLELLQNVAASHPNIRVFSRKHEGAGATRNFGITQARGDWIYFLDSDDRIEQGAFTALKNLAYKTGADVIYFDVVNPPTRSALSKRKDARKALSERIWRGRDYLLLAIRARAFRYSPCTQFIRRDFLLGEEITFPSLLTGEDVLFSIQVALRANRVAYLNEPLFNRLIRVGSTTMGSSAIQNVRDALQNCSAIKALEADFANEEHTVLALSELRRKLWRLALHRFDRLPREARASIGAHNLLSSHPSLSQDFLRESRRRVWSRSFSRWLHRGDAIKIDNLPGEPE